MSDDTYPLHRAVERNDMETVRRLVATQPQLISSVDFNECTPVHKASYCRHEGSVGMLRLLLEHAQAAPLQIISRGDFVGNTPLHWAAGENNVAHVRVLLQSGADPQAKNFDGRTPLQAAVLHGMSGAIAVLRQWRANSSNSQAKKKKAEPQTVKKKGAPVKKATAAAKKNHAKTTPKKRAARTSAKPAAKKGAKKGGSR